MFGLTSGRARGRRRLTSAVTARRASLERLERRWLLSVVVDEQGFAVGGLTRPDAAALAWEYQNMLVTQDVQLNDLGLSRVNAARAAQGLPALTLPAVARGWEATGATEADLAAGRAPQSAASSSSTTTTQALAAAVSFVDNSASMYFPPIRSQGSIGSCTAWATTYYAATYMTAFARNINVTTLGNAAILSPKWTYNMINDGVDNGSYPSEAYQVLLNHGAATWTQMPYDSNYKAWIYNNAATWRSAVGYRMAATGTVNGVDTDAGLATVKTMLTNGYVLNYGCDIYGWKATTVKNDPGSAADDAYVGQYAVSWAVTNDSGHEMTVVGFNDDIWIDVNNNGVVDTGEKGALKIANSWGTSYGTGGFAWVSYDALKSVSAVVNGPTANRVGAFWYNQVTWITARPTYTPTALAEFTVQTVNRNEMTVRVGISDTAGGTPSTSWYPTALTYDGGAFGFDGVDHNAAPSTSPAGTFVIDLTDLAPDLAAIKRYYLSVDDTSNSATVTTLSSFKLTDAAGNVLAAGTNGLRAGDLPATDSSTSGTFAEALIDYPATEIRGSIHTDKNSNGIKDTGEPALANWPVYADQNNNGVWDNVATTASSGTLDLAIPDAAKRGNKVTAGSVTSTININNFLNDITDVNLTLTIAHSLISEVTVFLTSPDGTRIQLVNAGHTGANLTNTTLDDQAGTPLGAGVAPYTGTFIPDAPLAGFTGLAGNGNWTLTVYDNVQNTTGTLVSWSLALMAPEPAVKTDSTGAYAFSRLTAGNYTLRPSVTTGFAPTFPLGGGYTDSILAQQILTGRDFAVYTAAPTVATPSAATPLTPTTAALSVLGADDGGESNLIYTWSVVTKPSGAATATFTANGTNAAKSSTINLTKAGTWVLRATITDAGALTVTKDVTYIVSPTLTTITVTPVAASLAFNAAQQYAASGKDQFAIALVTQPIFTWGATGGTITSTGLFTGSAPGTFTVSASSAGVTGTTTVTVAANPAPTVATAAAATPAVVTGTDTTLTVLGADDGGEANLTYLWSVVSKPAGAADPTFSPNNTNAAKSAAASFSQSGSYTLRATITDVGGLSVTSDVNVSVTFGISGIVPDIGGAYHFSYAAGIYGMFVDAGTVHIASDLSAGGKSIGLNIAAGATALVESNQHLTSLTLGAGASLQLTGLQKVLVTRSITLGENAAFDLLSNALVVDYTGGASPAPAISGYVALGFNGGNWLGKGLTSSTAASNSGLYALGLVDNALRGTPLSILMGESLPLTAVIVRLTYMDDLDLDGVVTSNDSIVFANNFSEGAATTRQYGDINYNGVFDSNDAILFANGYNESLPQIDTVFAAPPGGSLTATVAVQPVASESPKGKMKKGPASKHLLLADPM